MPKSSDAKMLVSASKKFMRAFEQLDENVKEKFLNLWAAEMYLQAQEQSILPPDFRKVWQDFSKAFVPFTKSGKPPTMLETEVPDLAGLVMDLNSRKSTINVKISAALHRTEKEHAAMTAS